MKSAFILFLALWLTACVSARPPLRIQCDTPADMDIYCQ